MEGSASGNVQETQPITQIELDAKKEPSFMPVKINFNRSKALPSSDKSLEEKIAAVQAIEADESDKKWTKKWEEKIKEPMGDDKVDVGKNN